MTIPKVLLEFQGLGIGEKIVFAEMLYLSQRALPGDAAEVYYPTLAARTGTCTIRARRRALALQDAGLIEITRDDYTLGYRILPTTLAEACRAGP